MLATEVQRETASRLTGVIILGPFPPPMAGAHKNTELLRNNLTRRGAAVLALQTGVPGTVTHSRTATYYLSKLRGTVANLITLFKTPLSDRVVFMVPDGGIGIWFSAMYAAVLRLKAAPTVFVQYRNYSFVRRRSLAMRLLVNALGARAFHIFLDSTMQSTFSALYRSSLRGTVVSNAATCDVRPPQSRSTPANKRHIVVGYLSNLTVDKGFNVTVEAFEMLAAELPDLRFAIAGPPADSVAQGLLDRAISSLGASVDYWGQIQGSEKQRFYESIDVFVFPTRYNQEAQPNVIFEAMAAGATVVATDHAGIPNMFGQAHHRLVALDESELADGLRKAVSTEAKELESWELRLSRRKAIIEAFESLQRESEEAYEALLAQILNQET